MSLQFRAVHVDPRGFVHLEDIRETGPGVLSFARFVGDTVCCLQPGIRDSPALIHMVTIKDIAQRLGVSASTITRALADSPRISTSLRSRVKQVADEMGYVAHAPARIMRGHRSSLLGLVVPDIQNEFYSTVAKAMSDCCKEAGMHVALLVTDEDPEVELRQVRGLASAQAAGFVVVATAQPKPETIALLGRVPHVELVRKSPRLNSDWFGIDDAGGLHLATRHLLSLGHRRIAYIGGSPGLSTGAARRQGYMNAMREAGLRPEDMIVDAGGNGERHARDAMRRLMQTQPRPTAVVSGGSRTTIGILQGLQGEGVRVPEELSVVGFNDSESTGLWSPGLTTLALPVREIALSCSALLLRRIRESGKDANPSLDPPYRATYATSLITRASTAPVREQGTSARAGPS
jgi:LacI family transcriptional regulator